MSKELTILYIEDDADIRAIADLALDGEGFKLVQCESGEEALAKAIDIQPDLLVLDVMMPGMDGPTTLKQLRELDHLHRTPAIFMTAKVQQSEIEDYLLMGAAGVIGKPFDPMTLAEQIREIIDKNDD